VTCQGGKARFTTSNLGGFNFAARISRRFQTSAADYNMSMSFKFDSTSPSPILWARADTGLGVATGYALEIGKGTWTITKWVSSSQSPLTTPVGTKTFGYADGIEYSVRFRVVGSTVQARVWLSADVEPSGWDYSATDSTISASGAWGIYAGAGNAAVNHNFFVDNFTLEAS
jgi:hypothetical protein